MTYSETELVPSALPESHNRRVFYAAATIFLTVLCGYTQVLPVFRNVLQSYFHVGVDRLGLLFSAGLIPGAVAVLIVGALVDRLGPRVLLRWCLIGSGIGMIAAFWGRSWVPMLLGVGLITTFSQPLAVVVQTYLVSLFPQSPRRAISVTHITMAAAGMVYPLWAEYLLRLHRAHPEAQFGDILHRPFAVLAVPILLGAFLYGPWSAQGRFEATRKSASGAKRIPLAPGSKLLIGMLIIHGVCDTGAIFWMPRVLGGGSFARHTLAPGTVVAAYSLAVIIARTLLALLPERVGSRAVLMVPGILGGGIFLTGILLGSQLSTAVGYVLGAFLWAVEYPAVLAVLAKRESTRFASATSFAMLGINIVSFIMTNAMGWLGAALGEARLWMILLLPAAGFPLVGIAGAIWLLRYGRQMQKMPAHPESH